MTLHHGDCLGVMAGMPESSVDAVVTDPPYGLEFMGKEWDRLGGVGHSNVPLIADHDSTNVYGRTGRISYKRTNNRKCRTCGHWEWSGAPCRCDKPDFPSQENFMQEWHQRWATEALRVAKPGSYLLAFGGTRTYHRLAVAIEDAGWIIRDCLVWAYAQGFPKSKALLKPAWEPIVMARKPGPLRELAIDACRLPVADSEPNKRTTPVAPTPGSMFGVSGHNGMLREGRWPANVILTDPIFDGNVEGVVGGGETNGGGLNHLLRRGATTGAGLGYGSSSPEDAAMVGYNDTGTYSRFFLIPKADRAEREPVIYPDGHDRSKRFTTHPTVKPLDLMRHLVRLVTPVDGTVLDPFLGSGTTGIAAEMEGFQWIGIEREAEYVAIAEARLMGVQRGMGLSA